MNSDNKSCHNLKIDKMCAYCTLYGIIFTPTFCSAVSCPLTITHRVWEERRDAACCPYFQDSGRTEILPYPIRSQTLQEGAGPAGMNVALSTSFVTTLSQLCCLSFRPIIYQPCVHLYIRTCMQCLRNIYWLIILHLHLGNSELYKSYSYVVCYLKNEELIHLTTRLYSKKLKWCELSFNFGMQPVGIGTGD